MSFDIFDPKSTCVKAFLISNVITYQSPVGVSIVHASDLSKSFLSSCIPNKHAHLFSSGSTAADQTAAFVLIVRVDVNGLDLEVPAEGSLCAVFRERLLDVSLDEGGFTSHRLAHTNDLKLFQCR